MHQLYLILEMCFMIFSDLICCEFVQVLFDRKHGGPSPTAGDTETGGWNILRHIASHGLAIIPQYFQFLTQYFQHQWRFCIRVILSSIES